jgi:recombination protein RecT
VNIPSIVAPKKEKRTIQGLLEEQNTMKKIKQVIPAHLNPERMLRVFAMAVYKTPKLAECEAMSLLGAMMACASFGLEPNTPLAHAYLIPFEKKKKQGKDWITERVDVNLIIGYRGYIDLARRTGELVSLHADVAYEGDDFSFEYGSNMHLRHVPKGSWEGRKPLYVYAHASLKDGQAFEVLPNEQVLKIRDNAQGYKAAVYSGKDSVAYKTSPWVAYEHEMKAKTMIRRLSKVLPMSIEFANAAALDTMSEANKVDFSAYADGIEGQFIDGGFIEDKRDEIPTINLDAEPKTPEEKPKQEVKELTPMFFEVNDHAGKPYRSGLTLEDAITEVREQMKHMQGTDLENYRNANQAIVSEMERSKTLI